MTGLSKLAAVVLAAIAPTSQAFAQTPELPRALIGVGVTRASSDHASRMRLAQEARPWIFSAEVGIRVAPPIGVGAEAVDFGKAIGETRGNSFRSRGEQRERAIVGLLRGRVWGSERVALDLVGGAGALFQRHIASQAPCFSGCAVAVSGEYTHRAPVLVAGADVPIRLGHAFSIAAIGRYYSMRRGDNTPDDPRTPIPWQFEHESSSRLSAGASARVIW